LADWRIADWRITDCGLRIADYGLMNDKFSMGLTISPCLFISLVLPSPRLCISLTYIMKITFLLCIFTFVAFMQAMDSWEICRGNKILAKASENDQAPTVFLSTSDTNALIINFKEAPSNIQWKRDFILRTASDSVLHQFSFSYSTGKFRLAGISSIISKHVPVTLITEQHPAKEDILARSKMLVIGTFQRK
jgi:hypothetical protein